MMGGAKSQDQQVKDFLSKSNSLYKTIQPNVSKSEVEAFFLELSTIKSEDELHAVSSKYFEASSSEEFEANYIDFINSSIQNFIDASRNKITKENREIFKFYVEFLRTTGVRTGEEATGILWKHIFISKAKNDRVVIKIEKGKNAKGKNKTREICIDQQTIENLMKLLMFQTGYNKSVKNTFDKF